MFFTIIDTTHKCIKRFVFMEYRNTSTFSHRSIWFWAKLKVLSKHWVSFCKYSYIKLTLMDISLQNTLVPDQEGSFTMNIVSHHLTSHYYMCNVLDTSICSVSSSMTQSRTKYLCLLPLQSVKAGLWSLFDKLAWLSWRGTSRSPQGTLSVYLSVWLC